MKLNPCFMLVSTDFAVLVGTNCGRMISREAMAAINENPFSVKAPGCAKLCQCQAAEMGPITRAMLN